MKKPFVLAFERKEENGPVTVVLSVDGQVVDARAALSDVDLAWFVGHDMLTRFGWSTGWFAQPIHPDALQKC